MGNNLAKLRGKHGVTQQELADAVGVTKQGMSYNETGQCSVITAKRAAAFLGENIFEVLGTDVFRVLPKTEEEKETFKKIVAKVLGE